MSKNHCIMQKLLLEVVMDDNGRIDFKTDNESLLDKYIPVGDPEIYMEFFRKTLGTVIDKMWKERETCFSKVIRLLSIAEVCAAAEPYMQAEEFWSSTMLGFIPETEEYADSLKMKYGYDPKGKTRPITGTGEDLMRMTGGEKWLS